MRLISYSIRRAIKVVSILLNRVKFALFDCSYGSGFMIFSRCILNIQKGGRMSVGDNFRMSSGRFNPLNGNSCNSIFVETGAELKIGNNVGISSSAIWAKTRVEISDNAQIGANCMIMDTDCHSLDWKLRCSREKVDGKSIDSASALSAPVVIENDVLIGARCIILKGVTIGARSVIGAGSVVSKSIPEGVIAAGNPCRVIRSLND